MNDSTHASQASGKQAHEKDSKRSTTSPLTIAAYWLVVGLPLAWGVYRTLLQALKLFA